ncbi:MAG: ATP-binding protein [Gammaproteobacteria bacterium]|nr:ATP-binding protein [Gammaproteobacteria bacterium]
MHTSEMMLKQQIYEQGLALTLTISRKIWNKYRQENSRVFADVLNRANYKHISRDIDSILEGTPALKLKLFDTIGRMRYSSNKKDIIYGDGDDLRVENKINLAALDVIKSNVPFSSYRFRKEFDAGERIYFNKYIISIYMPAYMPDKESVAGVVEIYYDVSNIVNEYNRNIIFSWMTLFLTGVVLFLLIGHLIWRNERITIRREIDREKYLQMIKNKNRELVHLTKEVTATQERTEKISAERSAFIARISHDLRTPMNAVIGLTDLIMRTNLSDKQRGYINAIQSSGNILLDITDEILTIGRLETGYLEIKEQPYTISEVIENVLEVMGNRAYRKGLELFCDFTPELENIVVGDPSRLRQILLNLIGNAIKYTDQGYIKIHVKHVKGSFGAHHYRFEVIDTGIGINKEDQGRIFAAYCHLDKSSKTGSDHTGLGLAITKRLIEAMNGVIGVDSAEGQGATFWFKLPLHTESVVENTENTILFNGVRCLALIPHRQKGQSVENLLSCWGIECDLAASRAISDIYIEKSFINIKPYNLFILDAVLDDGCGIELARKIRKHAAFNNSLIVLMVPISHNLQEGLVSGIRNTVCINKPVLAGKLKKLLYNVFGNARLNYDKFLVPDLKKIPGDLRYFANLPKDACRVLVVEDNPVNRELLLEMLGELNIRARAVENGAGVFDALMEETFELILLDYRLPDMDGHTVTAKVRNMKLKGRQPVIVVTSSDDSLQSQQLCYETGVDGFLHKPIKLENLSDTLAAWLPYFGNIRQEQIENQTTVVSLFSAPILDKNVVDNLKKRSTGNPEFFNRIVEIFINDSFERIDKIRDQLEGGDYTGLARSVHSFKSGCLHIGARRMAKYCEILSNMARNQSYNETKRAMSHFIEEFDRLILELDREQRPLTEPL